MSVDPIFRWTDELVDQLRRHARAGMSASQIATKLGATSRNAVIGKAHRLGIALGTGKPDRVKTKPGAVKPARPSISKVALPPAPAIVAPLPVRVVPVCEEFEEPTGRVPLLDLQARSCRWPLGDPREAAFGFCGRHRPRGATYCGQHASIAYASRAAQAIVERAR